MALRKLPFRFVQICQLDEMEPFLAMAKFSISLRCMVGWGVLIENPGQPVPAVKQVPVPVQPAQPRGPWVWISSFF